MKILGIETSCDETAASVVEGKGDKVEVLSSIISSQIEIHKKYGGVVPEVAAREHMVNILPVVNEALAPLARPSLKPRPTLSKFGEGRSKSGARLGLDAIAVTVGPGLVTSLLVGVETAKTLAYVWGMPVVAVNHIEGHIYANFIKPPYPPLPARLASQSEAGRQGGRQGAIKFPAVILTVSGGHTMLVLMKGHGRYKILGETRDDAAGEAFDKAAQLLGLGYPGGPSVAFQATKIKNKKSKIKDISLPRPMIKDKNFDFSFSGLKTALLYELTKDKSRRRKIPQYAAEFQLAVADVLVDKTIRAALKYGVKTVMLTGGVAANSQLRQELAEAINFKLAGANLIMPELKYCTDNAAMVAAAGYFRARAKDFTPWQKLKTQASLELK